MLNFRQFKGHTSVEFSCDPEKNVTVILGDNTFGKTTLLQAFNWCFYGKAIFSENANSLLNIEVANDLTLGTSAFVEVEIVVIHDNVEYVITRAQKYMYYGGQVKGEPDPKAKISYKQPDGQMESVKAMNVEKVINNILPEDLSVYFFFDTERVNSISNRKDVANSVKGLLGLSVIDNAMKHLGTKGTKNSVIGKLYANMDMEGDSKAQRALSRIQELGASLETIGEQRKECETQFKLYEERKEKIEAILRDNQSTTALQKKKDELDRLIKEENKEIEKYMNSFFSDFNNGSLAFFMQPLIERASGFLKEVDVDDKGVRDLTKSTIMELIKRGRCICGSEICEGNEAYQHLMDELSFVPPESIGNRVKHFTEKMKTMPRSADYMMKTVKDRVETIYRSKLRAQEWEDELLDISEQIKGKESMGKYESELQDIKKRLLDLTKKKESLIAQTTATQKDIDACQKVYDSMASVSGKNKDTLQYISYAETIYNWLSETYTQKEKDIRVALENKVNEIFEKMYHGHRRVVIDSRYQVELLSSVADKEIATGESEGTNRVKNFAFIAGLVSLAKEKITADSEITLSSEPYPLVMDAPFSNADEIHTANISRVLPEIAEQVIMFVMKKDWNYAQPVMEYKVGKQYHLHKFSETYTRLEK